jgi:hypothetical protein
MDDDDFDPGYDRNFDPDFHTPEERLAHHWARYEADPEYRHKIDATADVVGHIGREQEALERLAETDPMGFVFSGQVHDGRTAEQADAWLDSHLPGKPRK